ncbi:hypothetical protein L0222_12565 [bacterium]|nr:hypothetical protein [bacterium]
MNFTKQCCLLLVLLLFTPVLAIAVDSDADGLDDSVEATLGSSPIHKDIFVEIDWFVVNGRSLKPRKGFDKIVKAIFDSAPVLNPDGTYGIRIHLDFDDAIAVDFDTLGYKNANGNYNWDEFDVVKSLYFTSSRQNTHHYALFISDYGDEFGQPSGSSGISRNTGKFTAGASDFIVSLGGDYWYNYPKKKQHKWTQAGTFAHELGHNLGLKHGGNNHSNYKPNLLSILNYSFQVDGIPYTALDGTRYLIYDYSRQKLPTLNENSLNEFNGLGSGASDSAGVYGTTWFSWNGSSYDQFTTFNATSNVNWNNDSFLNSSVFEDTNQDGRYSRLKGRNQWSKLAFRGGLIGSGVSAKTALPRETSLHCLDSRQHAARKKTDDSNIPRITMKELVEKFKEAGKSLNP